MSASLRWTLLGVLAAIAITTTMDATGLTMFSALPLCPLLFLFWRLEKLPRRDVGFTWGRWRYYGLAVVQPALVLSAAAVMAWLAGEVNVEATDWDDARFNLRAVTVSTAVMVVITEKGFSAAGYGLRSRGQGGGRCGSCSGPASRSRSGTCRR